MIGISVLTFKLLVVSYITAKRQLIHNRTAQRNTWNQNYDFIVVGAGAAGCVVANRLTEDPSITVLLLEAGGPEDSLYTDIYWPPNVLQTNRPGLLWQYYLEPIPNVAGNYPEGRANHPMGKVIGGSTTHNAMTFNRGNRRIYDNWEKKYGAIGWSYKDVMPYFLKYENNTNLLLVSKNPDYHATSGPVQISSQIKHPPLLSLVGKAFNSLGYENSDTNGPNQTGVMYPQRFMDTKGLRVSSGTAYVNPNRHPKNLHIVTRAQVIKILFNGNKAIGVQFNRNETSYKVYALKETILSAGVFNTPQLLMLSGIGIREHLIKFGIPVLMDLPVGNNFNTHVQTSIGARIVDENLDLKQNPSLTIEQLSELYFEHGGTLSKNPTVLISIVSNQNYDINLPNIVMLSQIYENYLFFYIALTISRSIGTVRLQSSSPYIAPRIDTNYFNNSRDLDDLVDAVRLVFFVLENPNFHLRNIISLPSFESIACPVCPGKPRYQCTPGLVCYTKYYVASSYHPGGTCRMGAANRNDVVVDSLLRVKNINKLRVCDASIYPEVPNSNTAASAFMIGEKCAQIIKDCYHLK